MKKVLTNGLCYILPALAFCGAAIAAAPELINVGDHRLAIARSGQGSPTVVLESGGGSDIKAWSVILPRVGEFTSAVAYARAGRSDSEPAKTPRTLTAVVEELRTLLRNAGYKPPYVLVGRSLGGIYVRAFATMYPTEVAGLVLVDGSHERQGIELARALGMTTEQYLRASLETEKDDATRRELEDLAPVLATGNLGLSGKLPDLPTVIITNTRPDGPPAVLKAWRSLHDELFQSTTHGMHILTNQSGHDIAGHEPDLVINAVRWVIDAVRQANSAPKAPPTSGALVERIAITLPSATLAPYVGTYELRPGFDLVITLEGGQLMSQATGQVKVPLFAETETKFSLKVVDAQVEFVKDADGAVAHLVLHQGGRDHQALRKPYLSQ